MANQNLSQFTEKTFVADADHTFIWDTAGTISKRVSRNSWLNSGTLTSDAPVTISQTWNNAAVAFTALKVNAAGTSGTNSASGSLLADFQLNGVSQASVNKSGNLTVVGYLAANGGNSFLSGTTLRIGNSNGDINLSGGSLIVPSTTAFGWANTLLVRDGADNTLALRNGANAQTFNVYGTYTSITDYKRLSLSCSATTGNATIGVPFNSVLAVTGGSSPSTTATITFATQAAAFPVGSSVVIAGVTPSGYNGTYVVTASTTSSVSYTVGGALAAWSSGGTATVSGAASWILQSGGHLLAGADNAYDIGASGANRPRNLFIGGSADVAGTFACPTIYTGPTGNATALTTPTNGVFRITNNSATDFNRLQFGGGTSSFPAIKRVGAEFQIVKADTAAASNVAAADADLTFIEDRYRRKGTGTPEAAVTAPIGAVYHRTDGGAGTSFYVKESGTGNTGWVGK